MTILLRTLLACVILSGAIFARTHGAEPAVPKTLDEQIKYLEGALAESLRTRDVTMLDMAVNGFSAAKLAEKDLEISMLRAERDAALNNSQFYGAVIPAASIETWGLMARAKLGRAEALAALLKLAEDPPAAPEALPAVNKVPAAEYLAKKKVLDDYFAGVRKRGHALLVLALMKEPGIQERALATVAAKQADIDPGRMMGYNYGGGTQPAILAVLHCGGDAGFDQLLQFCADEKGELKDQAAVLGELNSFFMARNYAAADDKFSLDGALRQRLSKDAHAKLAGPFVSMLKRYTPDPKQPWDMTLNAISNIAMMLPEKALPPEGVTALEALTSALPGPKEQYPKQQFIQILKKYGKDLNAPVKPPKAESATF